MTSPITFSVSPASKVEGNSDDTRFSYTITLSEPAVFDTYVSFSLDRNAGATDGSDFSEPGLSFLISFEPGETQKAVDVLVTEDTAVEPDETFTYRLDSITVFRDSGVPDVSFVQYVPLYAETLATLTGVHSSLIASADLVTI
jgi:hypothetical protein